MLLLMKSIFVIFLFLSFCANGQINNNRYSDFESKKSISLILSPVFARYYLQPTSNLDYLFGINYNYSLRKKVYATLELSYERRKRFIDGLDNRSKCFSYCGILLYENELEKAHIINTGTYLNFRFILINQLYFELTGGLVNSWIMQESDKLKFVGIDSFDYSKTSMPFYGALYFLGGIGVKYVVSSKIKFSLQLINRGSLIRNIRFSPRDTHNYNIRFLVTYQLK